MQAIRTFIWFIVGSFVGFILHPFLELSPTTGAWMGFSLSFGILFLLPVSPKKAEQSDQALVGMTLN